MRAYLHISLLTLAACRPSASIQSTSPVANLQSYSTVGVRVHNRSFPQQSQILEAAVVTYLQQRCGFSSVGRLTRGARPDVALDLTITNMRRGGDGVIKNPNTAVVDTLVVLSDGKEGDILGTVRIQGKSSGMIVNNSVPENQAIDVVAKTIGTVFKKSGCSGARIAKAVPPPTNTPPPPPDPGQPAIDETKRPQAEKLNDDGKEALYAADLAGALKLFQQAVQTVPDAKYQFNVCVALGAQEQWDPAISACKQAKSMSPPAALSEKIDRRIDLLIKHQ